MTCVDNTVSVELFEKEAMAWDSLQMRCKAPVVAPRGEASGRPKRKPERKTKRSQGEKTNGRVLKAAKLAQTQAGPSLAVGKIKAKEERLAENKENFGASHASKQMTVLTTNRLTQKLHTGIYGQGKASGRILRRQALGDLKAPNIEGELHRILGVSSMQDSSAPEQKGTAVDCCKESSRVRPQSAKCDSGSTVFHQEGSAASSAVIATTTDSSDVMDDTPRAEKNDDEVVMKRTANNIIASLEPEKMFKCAGYVDSLKNDLRKMLRNNNPELYSELMAKFQQKRARSLEVYNHCSPMIPVLESEPDMLVHHPTAPTSVANAAPSTSTGTNTPGVLMDTSNSTITHDVPQPGAIFTQDHTHGTEIGGHAKHHQQGVVAPGSHHVQLSVDLNHVMLNSQSDPNLFGIHAEPRAQDYGVMLNSSPQPGSLFPKEHLSPRHHGSTHQSQTLGDQPGWDFLEIVDNQHVYNLPSRPQPVMVSCLSPPKMYPQKMF